MTQQSPQQSPSPQKASKFSSDQMIALSSLLTMIFTGVLTFATVGSFWVTKGLLEEARNQSEATKGSVDLATKAADAAVKQANAMAANVAISKMQANAAAGSAAAANRSLKVSQRALNALRAQVYVSKDVADSAKISASSAKQSAITAADQAKAFQTVQAGQLYIKSAELDLPRLDTALPGFPSTPVPLGKTPTHSYPCFYFYNGGQSDIVITGINLTYSVGGSVGTDFKIVPFTSKFAFPVGPHETAGHWLVDAPIDLSEETAKRIDNGKAFLLLGGSVTYRDVFGQEFDYGFAFLWFRKGDLPPVFISSDDPRFIYRRKHGP